jgi:type VII secretion-associated serine protease mycosin
MLNWATRSVAGGPAATVLAATVLAATVLAATVLATVVAATVGTGVTAGVPAYAARPASVRQAYAPTCQNPRDPQQIVPQTPWAQRELGVERAWPFTTGTGVTVAVVDSGTDAGHPQLDGRVLTGFDFLGNGPGGDVDCISHGTAVGSIIGAKRVDGIGFHGVAPGVNILPVRISEQEIDQNGNVTGAGIDTERFANAIRWAADRAKVINLSLVLYNDDPRVRAAIAYALAKDVVVVAAVGNQHDDLRVGPDPVPYPAAYDGVIGVGAVAEDGSRVKGSQIGPYVDLVAPGGAVLAASRVFGHNYWTGTSFATPFVSAAAALVRAYRPGLRAEQVTQRLLATASPAAGGRRSPTHGYGTVDPYRAVTDTVATAEPVQAAPLPEERVDAAAEARADRAALVRRVALGVGIGGGALAVALLIGAVVLRRGRRRGWQPGRANPIADPPEIDEPTDDLFAVSHRDDR